MPRVMIPVMMALAGAAVQVRSTTVPDFAAMLAAEVARVAPGTLGVAVLDLENGQEWSLHGDRPFPMQSTFKAPLAAAVLSRVDAGLLRLDQPVELREQDLSPPYSPISAAFPGRTRYTVAELLTAAAGGSDNTAADVLMKLAGGPAGVTQWLRSADLSGISIDRYEREFQIEMAGMSTFTPAWAKEPAFLAALNAVPADVRRNATAAYLADPRDTSTPRAAVAFLRQLRAGRLLSARSTELLLRIMTETTTGARRIKAALPAGATLAHKSGSARPDVGINPAVNDIGLVRLPNGREFAIATFLKGVPGVYEAAEDVIAAVTRNVLTLFQAPAPPAGPLVLGLDHVPVAVNDLNAAAAQYRALGFTLKPGQPHANGITNFHAKFRDGTEIELITAPRAVDPLTTAYRTHLQKGDGPAFLALYSPPELARRDQLAWTDLPYVFFGARNASPTDRPEHIVHANTADSLVSVWLADDDLDVERRRLVAAGAQLRDEVVGVPEPTRATVAHLAQGTIVLLPGRHQLVPGRRIVGMTVQVRDRTKAAFIPPRTALGYWLELR